MFSRCYGRILHWILAVATVTSLGCGLKLNEAPPALKNPDFQAGDKAQCLTHVLTTMSRFVESSATPAEVDATWECFRIALNLYGTYVRGQDSGVYTPREIATFFETYFMQNLKLSDRLLTEIMRVKQILVGGTDTAITSEELNRLIAVALDLKTLSLNLLPYMKVYSFKWKLSTVGVFDDDVRYFDNANLAIQDAAKELARIIALNDKSYKIVNFTVLLEEIAKLYNTEWPILESIKRMLPFIYKLKGTLAGGDETSIAANEWRRFALLGARGYIQYLRYYYFIKTNDQLTGGHEVIFIAKSFDDLFSYLGDMVAEKPEGVFTRAELLEVLQALTVFVPEIRVSDPFLFELMKFKRLLFGGSLNFFTPEDFSRARAKVQQFRVITEKVLAYLPVYTLNWDSTLGDYESNQKYFYGADQNLHEVMKGFSGIIEDSYDLNDIQVLIKEFEKLYPSDAMKDCVSEDSAMLGNLKKYLPILVSLKEALYGDQSSVVLTQQWGGFLNLTAHGYSRLLYYSYFVGKPQISVFSGQGLVSLKHLVFDSVDSFGWILSQCVNGVVPFSDLNKISSALVKAEIFPKDIDTTIVNDLFVNVFKKVLIAPEKRLAGVVPGGLSSLALDSLKSIFSNWYEAQLYISERIFQGMAPDKKLFGKEILAKFPEPGQMGAPLLEMQMLLNSPLSRSFDEEGRLEIGPYDFPYSLDSLSRMNYARMMALVGINSYAQDLQRIKNYQGFTLAEATNLFDDIKPLIKALGLFSDKKPGFVDSRFREANLFTPRADGDGLASYVETTDLAMGILSGLRVNAKVLERMIAPGSRPSKPAEVPSCKKKAEGGAAPSVPPAIIDPKFYCDVTTQPDTKEQFVDVSCFVNLYRSYMKELFSSMPGMSTYLMSLPRCQKISQYPWVLRSNLVSQATERDLWNLGEPDIPRFVQDCTMSFDTVMVNILVTSGYVVDSTGKVSLGSAGMAPHLMQYIEQLIQRFDRDRNGVLTNEEAMASYPVFRKLLSDVSGYSDDLTLRGLLGYFMVYGKPPGSIIEKVYFYLFFRGKEQSWDIQVDRAKLAAIMGEISNAINTKKTALIGADPTRMAVLKTKR